MNNEYTLSERDCKIMEFLTSSHQWRTLNRVLILLNSPILLTSKEYDDGKKTILFDKNCKSNIYGVNNETAKQFAIELLKLLENSEEKVKNVSVESIDKTKSDISEVIPNRRSKSKSM